MIFLELMLEVAKEGNTFSFSILLSAALTV